MRHNTQPESKWICPITGEPYMLTWTDKGLYDSCPRCKPGGIRSVREALEKIENRRDNACIRQRY